MKVVRLVPLALVVILAALLTSTASADNGLPRELDPRTACPPDADPASLNRMAQIRMEVLSLVNFRDTAREHAIRTGGITPQLEYQIAELMQRRQVLESELADRQAWAARELARCQAAVRAARVQRIGTIPIAALRQIPSSERLPEERNAIMMAERAELAEASARADRAQAAARQAALAQAERQASQERTALTTADPKLTRLILSAHLCHYKSRLAHSIRQNNFALYKGQLDGEVEDAKDLVACTTERFKSYNLTPLDCANKRMRELTHCLPSIYTNSDTIIVEDSNMCRPEGNALLELDELMGRNHWLDKCELEEDDEGTESGPADMTRARARKLGLSETKVALSARRCNFMYKLQQLAKKPDPESVPPATARALLDMANRQLTQADIKPMACTDRMVKTALPCLPSIHGELSTPLWCTEDTFTRFMMLVDRAIPLGVKIPWIAGSAEAKIDDELTRMGIETEMKGSVSGSTTDLSVTILKDPRSRSSDVIADILIKLFKSDLAKGKYSQLSVVWKEERTSSRRSVN